MENMHAHKKSYHSQHRFACDKCDYTTNNKTILGKHKKTNHSSDSSNLCNICGDTFVNRRQLREHVKTHKIASSRRLSWTCPIAGCGSEITAATEAGLHEGKRNHHKRAHVEASFACDFCDAKFHIKKYYHVHMNQHKGEKPFKCEQCNKAYTSKDGLRQHYKKSVAHRK